MLGKALVHKYTLYKGDTLILPINHLPLKIKQNFEWISETNEPFSIFCGSDCVRVTNKSDKENILSLYIIENKQEKNCIYDELEKMLKDEK